MSADVTTLDQVPERVEAIGRKLDSLSESVDHRFDEVSEAFVEQRKYTEFAFSTLEQRMDARFDRVEERIGNLETGFGRLERKIDGLEGRFEGKFADLEGKFMTFESKLDQIIEMQSAKSRRRPRRPKTR